MATKREGIVQGEDSVITPVVFVRAFMVTTERNANIKQFSGKRNARMNLHHFICIRMFREEQNVNLIVCITEAIFRFELLFGFLLIALFRSRMD